MKCCSPDDEEVGSVSAEDIPRESIAGAASAPGELPAPLGAELFDLSREAFTAGLHTAAGVGATVFVGLAVLATTALRHVPPTGEALHDQADHNDGTPIGTPGADHNPKEVPM